IPLASPAPFTNPLSPLIAKQPYVIYADGYWYYMYTSHWEIEIARTPTLDGLKQGGQKKTIFPKLENDRNFYNPRLYKIDNTWWLYYRATPDPGLGRAARTQDFYALKGGATVPDTFSNPVKIANETTGQLLRVQNRLYFLNNCGDSICIAPMSSPTSIGTPAVLAVSDQDWEFVGLGANNVNQRYIGNPTPFYHEDKIFIAYELDFGAMFVEHPFGLLTYKGSGDPTLSSSWTKSGPFQNVAYKKGNASCYSELGNFFVSPDGSEVWTLYNTDNLSDGCTDPQNTGAKRLGWNADGSPNFGVPGVVGQATSGPSGE
ncbi:glycosyl hydrolase, partial [Cercophora newfieldiana]